MVFATLRTTSALCPGSLGDALEHLAPANMLFPSRRRPSKRDTCSGREKRLKLSFWSLLALVPEGETVTRPSSILSCSMAFLPPFRRAAKLQCYLMKTRRSSQKGSCSPPRWPCMSVPQTQPRSFRRQSQLFWRLYMMPWTPPFVRITSSFFQIALDSRPGLSRRYQKCGYLFSSQ
jgi:hypothetical protein